MSLEAVMTFMVNTKAALQEVKNFKQKVQNATNEMKKNALSSILPAAGAFIGFKALKDVYNTTRKLADFSERFSLPVENVSRFSNVLSLFGGTTETAVSDLGKLEQAIVDLRTTGGGALRTVANQIGLSLYDENGKIKGSLELLKSLREEFKGRSDHEQLKAAQELGLDDPATLRFLRASDEEYAQMTAQANEMNVISQSTADKVQQLNKILAEMRASWQGIGATILGWVLKPVQYLADAMKWLNDQNEGTKKIIMGIAGAFMMFVPAISVLSYLANALSIVSNSVQFFVNFPAILLKSEKALTLLKVALNGMKIGQAFGLAGLITAGYIIYDNWDKVVEVFNRAKEATLNYLASSPKLLAFLKILTGALVELVNAAKEMMKWLSKGADFAGKTLYKLFGSSGAAKPIEQMTDEEYADEYGVSIERAKKIRENRKRFQKTGQLTSDVPVIPTAGERRVMQSQTQNVSTDNSARTVVQNITVNADSGSRGRDIAQKTANAAQSAAKNIIYQNAAGVRK